MGVKSNNWLYETNDQRSKLRHQLLTNIKQNLPEIKKLLHLVNDEYEEFIYRYYFGSFKVFNAQEYSLKIAEVLTSLLPGIELHPHFISIIEKGSGKTFDFSANDNWENEALPILNAFLHARHILEMLVKYGEELEDPDDLPYGWATVLILYDLR